MLFVFLEIQNELNGQWKKKEKKNLKFNIFIYKTSILTNKLIFVDKEKNTMLFVFVGSNCR